MILNKETIYIGGGCFWCIETIFNQVKGVEEAVSGYMGGNKEQANYKNVCLGNTGHAEVVKVVFNKNMISLSKILEIFFSNLLTFLHWFRLQQYSSQNYQIFLQGNFLYRRLRQ